MGDRYRVAGVQMEVQPELRDNAPRILAHIAWAGQQEAQFCLFPEMSLSGYHGRFGQDEVDRALAGIALACAVHGVTALVGTGVKIGERTFIQQRIYAETGDLVGFHSKMVPTSGDRKWCAPGAELKTFERHGLIFGVLICNDLWVTPGCGPYPDPRLCYQLGQRGARVVFQAINSGSSAIHIPYHESNLALRARESGFHIITANAARGDEPVNCSSGVMGPSGEWLTRVDRVGEHAYIADIEIA